MSRALWYLALLWQLPLALLSLVLFKIVKFCVLLTVVARVMFSRSGRAPGWSINSEDSIIRTPWMILKGLIAAPRWNTAALVGRAGPMPIAGSVELDLDTFKRSSEHWVFIIYQMPRFTHAVYLSPRTSPDAGGVQRFDLAPGKYLLTARYYRCPERVHFPAVAIDGQEVVPEFEEASTISDFHHQLRDHSNAFYVALNYYIHVIVKHRRLFPESWVRRELLPVGDPGNRFHYGYLTAGEALAFRIPRAVLDTHYIFFTSYDRASMPISWFEVTESEFTGPPCSEPCVYLVRVVRTRPGSDSEDDSAIELSPTRLDGDVQQDARRQVQ